MVYGCANSCVKFVFFVSNLLICILGGLVCGFSLWANLDKQFGMHLAKFARQVDSGDHLFVDELARYQASLWILVAVGALLFLVGFLGCCGAGCENPSILGLFFFAIVMLTVVEVGATVYAISNRDEFVNTAHQLLEKSSATPELRRNIKPIQDVFQCCGATEKTQHLYIQDGLCGTHTKYPENCFDRISHLIKSSSESVVVIGVVLLAIQLFSLCFSFILCRAFQQEIRYTPYYNN